MSTRPGFFQESLFGLVFGLALDDGLCNVELADVFNRSVLKISVKNHKLR